MFGNRCNQSQHWDLLVIGGGITGAGIALEAARLGQKTLLLEQQDFAWGTSSRSSKMVHGGLRYIAQGDIRLTRHALLERERLLRELPDLVVRKTYLFPVRKGQFPGRWPMKIVLWLYDFMAGIRDHRWLPVSELKRRVPDLNTASMKGAMSYTDALTDDCRLVMRVLHEAVKQGANLANYSRVTAVAPVQQGFQVSVEDSVARNHYTLTASRVINATGAWADSLSGTGPRVRPLRGSHLFISQQRLPVDDCLTLLHPQDARPVFLFPWEGLTCVGTTDLDHRTPLTEEPHAVQQEIDYLLTLINSQFPELAITEQDIVSTMAGVRPVISSGKGLDPSKERRDHAIWSHQGVITVSGGKLTTFRLIALDALKAAGLLDEKAWRQAKKASHPLFTDMSLPAGLGNPLRPLPAEPELQRDLEWILRHEMVIHLDDLLLRRTRLGNLQPRGGEALFALVRPLCEQYLGWNETRWQEEVERYRQIIRRYYSLPAADEAAAA